MDLRLHSFSSRNILCGHTALANGLVLLINPGGLVGNVVLCNLYVRRTLLLT